MARQRNSSGAFSPASAGIGQQIMYTPEWADIDFADFQGLNMNLVNQNAQFAQEVANKRLENILQEQKSILESVKLHKVQSDLRSQLENKMSSIIDNMGDLQLSDAANYTALNTNLMRAQNDPVLQSAVKSAADASAYEKAKFEKPEIATQPWNNENEEQYQRFLKGETNTFSFNPIYKEYDLQSKADDFAKQVPPDVLNDIVKYGVYGLQEKAVEDKSVGRILNAFTPFKQGLMQDPEFMSWYKRRGKYEETRGGSIDDVINNMFKSSAAKFGTTTPTVKVGMPREDVDLGARLRVAEAGRDAARFKAEQAAGFPSATGKEKTPKKPDTYINFDTGVIKYLGKDLDKGEKQNLLNSALNPNVFKGPFRVQTTDGKWAVAPKPGEDDVFTPTGKIDERNKDGKIFVEYSNNQKGMKKKTQYKIVAKNDLQEQMGVYEYTEKPTSGNTSDEALMEQYITK